jgi:hypothetical protein
VTQPSRLSEGALGAVGELIAVTGRAWIDAGLVARCSYGVVVVVAVAPGRDFAGAARHSFPHDVEGSELDGAWFIDNVSGKIRICEASGSDSHVAVRLHPGALVGLRGAFPWGGAIIDTNYGLIVGTSGFVEDEDIAFSQTVLSYLRLLLDREGTAALMAAREREHGPDAATARFT